MHGQKCIKFSMVYILNGVVRTCLTTWKCYETFVFSSVDAAFIFEVVN